jgi:hypothetical protein
MPVFKCKSCQRLLYRPEELLGRAWQCPICGPTHVSEEPVAVPAELAARLEEEYRLSCSRVPVKVTSPFSSEQAHLRRNIRINTTMAMGKRSLIVASALALLLGILVSVYFGKMLSKNNSDLLLGLVCMGGSLGFVLLCLIGMGVAALYRRHVVKRVEQHLSNGTVSPSLNAIVPANTAINADRPGEMSDRLPVPESKANG